MSLKSFLAQPSTILGLGTAAATIAGLIAHAITHDITVSAAAGGAAFALVHVALPDNSAAQTSIEKLTSDAVTAIVQKKLAASLPLLFTDGVAVAQAFAPATTVTTTVTPAPLVPTV